VESKEIMAALEAMDPGERDGIVALHITDGALAKAIGTVEGFQRVRPLFDKHTQRGIETYALNHPPAGKASEAIEKKLDKLERAHAAAAAAADLRFFTYKRASELGIEYELVADLSFPDVKAADAKLLALGAALKTQQVRDINERLANGFKPGAGNRGDTPRDPHSAWIAGLPAADRAALEDAKRH
jgi:hypothetical protein